LPGFTLAFAILLQLMSMFTIGSDLHKWISVKDGVVQNALVIPIDSADV
jgi:hypothetical protein